MKRGEPFDETLMLRYGKGDVQAFEVLYRRHKDVLYRFVWRYCRDREVAADLVQDIWMKVIKARKRYRVQARFRAYLFTLARHRLIDAHRAQRADLCVAALDDAEGMADDAPDEPAMLAHCQDLLERALHLVDRLPAVQREAIRMYVEGFAMPAIAKATAVSAETARSRVRRALARVRKRLEDFAP
jgi:RNA polymerase sigma-70 factor (ECF subfamily)